uniref:Olfactory receptor 10V1-like n=1 Tax=Ursus maritimus TaxID=29073 RepID=A0A384CC37_URSMA
MESANQTGLIHFHFHPFSKLPGVQVLIFVAFLILYLVSIGGNVSISLIIWISRSLHTPMYFFLANLAVLEICYSSTIAPLTLASMLSPERALVSLPGCGTQMFFFIFLGSSDCILLAVMAYDSSKEISLFYCDVLPVMRLACADTWVHEATLFVVSITVLTVPFLLITLSYVFIGATILQIHSAEGRHKAFSTCSSHLTVVLLQYGCGSLIYLCPSSSYSPDRGQGVSAVYTFITPVLNPLVYSMRNRELKDALRRTAIRFLFS